MVSNLKKITNSQLCISTTGIAGPTGGSFLKPIGLVYVGIIFNKHTKIYMFNFDKKLTRKQIQTLTVKKIFKLLELII